MSVLSGMTTPPEQKSPRISRSAKFVKAANQHADLKVAELEKKLQQDLNNAQQSLINELQEHGLLLKPTQEPHALSQLMNPINDHLQECFEKTRTRIDRMGENKNYFAMSLKAFFIKLSTKHPDLLELMCHNYVHQWVNKDTTFKSKQPKDTKTTPVSRKLWTKPANAYEQLVKATGDAASQEELPSYQKPTVNSIVTAKLNRSQTISKKAEWKPNSIIDKTREQGYKKISAKSEIFARSKTADPVRKQQLEKDEAADAAKSVKAEDIEKITQRLYTQTEQRNKKLRDLQEKHKDKEATFKPKTLVKGLKRRTFSVAPPARTSLSPVKMESSKQPPYEKSEEGDQDDK